MVHAEILKPVTVLVLWTLVVLGWLVARRMPALKEAGIDVGKARGGRPGGLDSILPERVQWPAHNYIHLVEQPTLFYAVALTLAITGAGGGLNALLGWMYVSLRIAHSVVQVTSNRVAVRFAFFAASTLVLIALAGQTAIAVFLLHS